MTLALALAAVLSSWAAETGSEKKVEDKALLGPAPIHWLKVYSLSPYRELWSLELTVKNLESGLPKVREAVAKSGAVLTHAFDSFPASDSDKSQQLSYRLAGKDAKASLKRLRKLGLLREPIVRPSMEPVPIDEVREKQRRLQADRDAHAKELAGMPAVSALVDELLDHLRIVRAVRESADTEVLVNLTVRQQ